MIDEQTDRWTAVDTYFTDLLEPPDPVLAAALEASSTAGLPPIAVSPAQGRFLNLLVRVHGTRRVLELGTLAAYSTIWMARGLPTDGRVVTIEAEPRHAEVARENLARAGLEQVVDLRVGTALDVLPALAAQQPEPFDFVFIDADKANTPDYFRWSLELTRVGGLIVVDNVVRRGAVVEDPDDPDAAGIRRFAEMLAAEPRVSAGVVQTVGVKGHDGFALALVTDAG